MKKFLTAWSSCKTRYFWGNRYRSLLPFTLLLVPFVSKLVNYSRCAQWAFEEYFEIDKSSFSMENVVDFELLRIFLKYPLRFEKLTNLNKKGTERSVKIWPTNFCHRFSKNFLVYMNCRQSKILSLHANVIHRMRMVYFERYCNSE